jgi:hypothetical protein
MTSPEAVNPLRHQSFVIPSARHTSLQFQVKLLRSNELCGYHLATFSPAFRLAVLPRRLQIRLFVRWLIGVGPVLGHLGTSTSAHHSAVHFVIVGPLCV